MKGKVVQGFQVFKSSQIFKENAPNSDLKYGGKCSPNRHQIAQIQNPINAHYKTCACRTWLCRWAVEWVSCVLGIHYFSPLTHFASHHRVAYSSPNFLKFWSKFSSKNQPSSRILAQSINYVCSNIPPSSSYSGFQSSISPKFSSSLQVVKLIILHSSSPIASHKSQTSSHFASLLKTWN